MPFSAKKLSSMRKRPVSSREDLEKMEQAASAMISGLRALRTIATAEKVVDRVGGYQRACRERVDGNSFGAQLSGEPEHDKAHAELGHGIAGVRREPLFLHVERRRGHENVRICRLFEMGNCPFRDDERA